MTYAASSVSSAEICRSRGSRPSEIDVPLCRPVDQVGGIGGREDHGVGLEELDREHQALGVPVPSGTSERTMRSNEASAAPATNGPALYVETIRWSAVMPDPA